MELEDVLQNTQGWRPLPIVEMCFFFFFLAIQISYSPPKKRSLLAGLVFFPFCDWFSFVCPYDWLSICPNDCFTGGFDVWHDLSLFSRCTFQGKPDLAMSNKAAVACFNTEIVFFFVGVWGGTSQLGERFVPKLFTEIHLRFSDPQIYFYMFFKCTNICTIFTSVFF